MKLKNLIQILRLNMNTDFRQTIADKWPKSIDDKQARNDWGWKPKFDLTSMTSIMLEKLKEKYNKQV